MIQLLLYFTAIRLRTIPMKTHKTLKIGFKIELKMDVLVKINLTQILWIMTFLTLHSICGSGVDLYYAHCRHYGPQGKGKKRINAIFYISR